MSKKPKTIVDESKELWIKIPDGDVVMLWACPKCKNKVYTEPDWHEANGTPMCSDWGCDMRYKKVEVKETGNKGNNGIYKKVPDTSVRFLWRCGKCKGETYVYPYFYEDAGTPVCCDEDMTYKRSEVKVKT